MFSKLRSPVTSNLGPVLLLVACLAILPVSAHAAAGDLDPTFSNDGRVTTNIGGPNDDLGFDLVRQADGKIIVVGFTENSAGESDFALVRYRPGGALDTTFSGDGKARTDFGGASDFAEGVAVQPDGKIVVVGVAQKSPSVNRFAVARYKPNGALDRAFSGDGKTTVAFAGGESSAFDVALQSDGRIVTAGNVGDAAGGAFALARFKLNGALDESFSRDGKRTTDFAEGFDDATGIAVQADGKLVVAGKDDKLGAGGNDNFALVRFKPNGGLDEAFSRDGKTTTDFGGRDGGADTVLQPDGKIVAAGFAQGFGAFALARYKANGALDEAFSGDGKTTTNFVDGFEGAAGVALQPDGKIVAAGSARANTGGSEEDFALGRYRPNGALDRAFSGDGKRTLDFGGRDQATGVFVQPDGKITAGGFAFAGATGIDFAVARFRG